MLTLSTAPTFSQAGLRNFAGRVRSAHVRIISPTDVLISLSRRYCNLWFCNYYYFRHLFPNCTRIPLRLGKKCLNYLPGLPIPSTQQIFNKYEKLWKNVDWTLFGFVSKRTIISLARQKIWNKTKQNKPIFSKSLVGLDSLISLWVSLCWKFWSQWTPIFYIKWINILQLALEVLPKVIIKDIAKYIIKIMNNILI